MVLIINPDKAMALCIESGVISLTVISTIMKKQQSLLLRMNSLMTSVLHRNISQETFLKHGRPFWS